MAQMIFDASKYPNGTLLSSFDWKSNNSPAMDFQVVEIGTTGRKYWSQIAGSSNNQMIFQNLYTDYEMLLIADFTGDEVSGTFHGLGAALKVFSLDEQNNFFTSYFAKVSVPSDTLTYFAASTTYLNTTATTPPTGLLSEKAMAMRVKLTSSELIKARFWAANVGELEADEPITWNHEGTFKVIEPSAPAFVNIDGQLRISTISLGTAGDPAVFSVPGQTVTTPTGLTVTNITATTADVDWT